MASKANGLKRLAAFAIADGSTSGDQGSHSETRSVKVMKRPSSASSMVSAGVQEETLASRPVGCHVIRFPVERFGALLCLN